MCAQNVAEGLNTAKVASVGKPAFHNVSVNAARL